MIKEYFKSIMLLLPHSLQARRFQDGAAGPCWNFLGSVKVNSNQLIYTRFRIVSDGAFFLDHLEAISLQDPHKLAEGHSALFPELPSHCCDLLADSRKA